METIKKRKRIKRSYEKVLLRINNFEHREPKPVKTEEQA
jgi:hypothetical protein